MRPAPTTNSQPEEQASSRTPALSPAGRGISREARDHSAPDLKSETQKISPVNPCARPERSRRTPSGESTQPDVQPRNPDACSPWIPESKLPPLPNHRINSLIRKILLTTPEFPRIYADIILSTHPNSHEAKILQPHYQKLCEKVNAMSNQNGTCTHIKVTGVRCGSPALKGEPFCYFHQNAIRSVRRPKQSRLHPIALIEDEESIQYALMEVINALMKNTIDLKRATLILRALHIAVKNASRVKFGIQGKSSVTQVPDYAPPPDNADFDETTEIDLPYNAWVPPRTERQIAEEKHRAQKLREWKDQQAEIRANLERASRELAAKVPAEAPGKAAAADRPHEGTAAIARPASEAGGLEAPPPKPATPIPPHNFTPAQATRPAQPNATKTGPATRKPPQPAAAAPKEHKNAAHGASRG
jgi:hypothetical protein